MSFRFSSSFFAWQVLLSFILKMNALAAPTTVVELDVLSLDPSMNCNRTFYQSPSKIRGIVFYVPKVIPGEGYEGSQVYDLKRSQEPGYYDLTLNVFFPSKESQINSRSNASSISRAREEERCNLDRIKYYLNNRMAGTQFQVTDIKPSPLTQIEFKIPGVQAIGRLGSDEEGSEASKKGYLQYLGEPLSVMMRITEREKELIERRLVSTGLVVNTRLNYFVKNQTGFVHAKVDLADLSTKISAQAEASGIKAIGVAEFRALVSSVANEQSIKITTEGAVTEQGDRVLQMILQRVFQSIQLDQLVEREVEPQSGASAEKKGGLLGKIQIAAAIERLKQTKSTEVSFSTVSDPVEATTKLQMRFKVDKLNDPNLVKVKLQAGYDDPSSGLDLKKDETLIVNPAYTSLDQITYEEVRSTFLTVDEMMELRLENFFPDITNSSVQIKNENINGHFLAEGKWSADLGITRWQSPNRIRWVRNRRIPKRRTLNSGVYESDFEKWNNIPIQLTFSELGDRHQFPISKLLEPSPFWTSRFDDKTGRLFLKAKQNLGSIRVRESIRGEANLQYSKAEMIMDEVIQYKYLYFGGTEIMKRQTLASDPSAIIRQRSIVLFLSLESKKPGN